jgi:hypothetical protein
VARDPVSSALQKQSTGYFDHQMLTRSKRANPVRTLNVVTRFVWTAKRGDDGRARYLQHCHAADGSHSSSARSTKYSERRTTSDSTALEF